jgi:uncharacterized protein YggU (UPF0235/DUF167 family)
MSAGPRRTESGTIRRGRVLVVEKSALRVPRRDVHLVHGTSSRIKRIEVRGLRVEEVRMRLATP